MIKAHTSHVDLLERHSQEAISASDMHPQREESTSSRAESVANLEARLRACCDEEARAAFVQTLKAQVDSDSYHIDSTILAQKMQDFFTIYPAPEVENEGNPHAERDELLKQSQR